MLVDCAVSCFHHLFKPISNQSSLIRLEFMSILYTSVNPYLFTHSLIHFLYLLCPELRVTGLCWRISQQSLGEGPYLFIFIEILKSKFLLKIRQKKVFDVLFSSRLPSNHEDPNTSEWF